MALRKVLKIGDETLRKKSRPVDKIDERLLELLDDLKETLKKEEGVGIAAPQVGILRRVIVIDTGDGSGPVEMINPEILEMSGEVESTEGCLSVPNITGKVIRPEKVKVRARNREGKLMTYDCQGLFAIVACHETDHLDGVLFVDKMVEQVKD